MLCQRCDTQNPADARFCAHCATQLVVLPQPTAAPQRWPFKPRPARQKRGLMRTTLLACGVLFALLMVCTVGVALSIEDEPTRARAADAAVIVDEDELAKTDEVASDEAVADEEGAAIPEQQAAFIHTVESFVQPYQEAANELQAFTERAKRKAALEALVPDRMVEEGRERWQA